MFLYRDEIKGNEKTQVTVLATCVSFVLEAGLEPAQPLLAKGF